MDSLCDKDIPPYDLPSLKKALRDAFDAAYPATVIVLARTILEHTPEDALT